MLWSIEGWAIQVEDINKLQTSEMKMLQMIYGKTLKNEIRSEFIQ